MVDLSVVLPAYNEIRIIGSSLGRLRGYLDRHDPARPWRSWEIVIVDDGSDDGTPVAARQTAGDDARIRVLEHPVNRGKGAAVKTAIDASRGALILVTDVDLSYAVEDLGRAAARMTGSSDRPAPDIVTGDRRHPDSRMDLALSVLWHVVRRQTLSALFNTGVRLFFNLPWQDTQCGLKGFRREAALRIYRRIRTAGFLTDIEIFIIARSLKLSVERLPVHLTYLSSDSTVHVMRQIPDVVRDAMRIKRAQMRGDYERDSSGT